MCAKWYSLALDLELDTQQEQPPKCALGISASYICLNVYKFLCGKRPRGSLERQCGSVKDDPRRPLDAIPHSDFSGSECD